MKTEEKMELAFAILSLALRFAPGVFTLIRRWNIDEKWTPERLRTLKVDPEVRKYYEGTNGPI